MNHTSKNRLLTWLVIILVLANIATITMFWLNRPKHPADMPGGRPKDFLVKELKLDAKQQEQLEVLVKEHRAAAEALRLKIKDGKESFFELLKQPGVSDSAKQAAAKAISAHTEELDLLTFNHFQKIRALCNADQQKKFDSILQQVTNMIAQPRPPGGPGGPPPGAPDGKRGDGPPPQDGPPPPDGPPGNDQGPPPGK